MKRPHTYIALLLTGIFFIAISSQATHVLLHSSQLHSECSHGDHEHKSDHNQNSDSHSEKKSLKFDTLHEHCFICEFEFSIVEEPGHFIVETVIPQQNISFIFKDYSLSKTFPFHAKSPRAPPGFVS
jgi:hypothetical protein